MPRKFLEITFSRVFGQKYFRLALLGKLKEQLSKFLASSETVEFSQATPIVSIIVPVFDGAHHTLQCLQSLHSDKSVPFEVIIFDNGSHDETCALLEHFQNVRIIKSKKNLGFIKAVNAAASQARGEFLLLFNNDAKLISGTIANAVEVFKSEPKVGAVGARIMQADGQLQEAGCMVFQNGTTNGYLRFGDVEDPRAMFMRDVDYCSGTFLMVGRQQFLDFGGLDEIYEPAYFEETDLCMKMRTKGLRIIYNPSILIEHFEFGSQPSERGRKLIAERRPIFLARWQKQLRSEGYAASEWGASKTISALRLIARPRLLLVLDSPALFEFSKPVRELISSAQSQGWHITLGTPSLPVSWVHFHKEYGNKLEIVHLSWASTVKRFLRSRQNFYNLYLVAGDVHSSLVTKLTTRQNFRTAQFEYFEAMTPEISACLKMPLGAYSV
jgi:GT2 family glycosyltransferase